MTPSEEANNIIDLTADEEATETVDPRAPIQQESAAMTPEEAAHDTASDIKAYAAVKLRARHTHLKSEVLSQMLEKIASEI